MRRDWRIIRDLLIDTPEFEASPDALDHHIAMCKDAGLLDFDSRVTMRGADLGDLLRDERVWAFCVEMIAWNGGGAPEDLLVACAKGARQRLADRESSPDFARHIR